jgi:hypothetical protein
MLLNLGNVISTSTTMAGRSDFSASEVSFYANLALTEVSNRLHMNPKEAEAFSNVTGTGGERRIGVPQDFDYVMGLKFYSTTTDPDTGDNILGTEYDLDIVDSVLIDSFSSTSGVPQRYSVYGRHIELDPIPNSRGSLVMRYAAQQETLVLSTETPDLDEKWHPGWLWKTVELVHLARGNAEGAASAENKYVNYMISTPNDRQQEQMAKKGLGLWVRKA